MHNDIKEVILTEKHIKSVVKNLGTKITNDYTGTDEDVHCIGILKGASVFYADLVRAIDYPVVFDFMIVSSYGGSSESSGAVKILKDLDFDIADKHVIIVEDIIDSGTTMAYLKNVLKYRNPKSVKICALLSKPSRREVEVDIDYLGLEVPDEFLVGYGLDYAEKYRNLPYIGSLKRELYS